MLRRNTIRFNYFPLGYKSGPENCQLVLPVSNFDSKALGNLKNPPVDRTKKTNSIVKNRRDLTLKCSYCEFRWKYDTLTVHCLQKEHHQREMWLPPSWSWHHERPYQFYKSMHQSICPRTGLFLAHEDAKGNNNERRGQGLGTLTRRLELERRGISRYVAKYGSSFNQHWRVGFPLPV